MRYDHITESLHKGMLVSNLASNEIANLCSLLMSPFEYTEAFNKALKNVIKTLPNRPARETAEDVVSKSYEKVFEYVLKYTDVLLRIYWRFWRERLQPPNARLLPPQPYGVARRYRHKMLARSTENYPECTLQREEEQVLCKEV